MKKYIFLGVLIALVGCGKGSNTQADDRYLKQKAADKERYEKGAYVAKEKQLSPTESLRLVIVPARIDDMFDAKCLIYINTEYKVAQMQCPDLSDAILDE